MDSYPTRPRFTAGGKYERDEDAVEGRASAARVVHGPCPDQRGDAETRGGSAVHDDASRHVRSSVAYRLPSRRTDADHRKGRTPLARDPARREDVDRERTRGFVSGPGWNAGDLPVPALRDRSQH